MFIGGIKFCKYLLSEYDSSNPNIWASLWRNVAKYKYIWAIYMIMLGNLYFHSIELINSTEAKVFGSSGVNFPFNLEQLPNFYVLPLEWR